MLEIALQVRCLGHLPHVALRRLDVAQDDHQKIVEVVRDAAAELADRLHLLRCRELLLGLAQRLLRLVPLGDVARDLREAEQLALFVAYGVNHDQRPEAAPVLAYAPALCLETAMSCGGRQGAVGQAISAVLFSVEEREVTAYHLICGVALDTRRSRIPGGDPALSVQLENSVVDHRLDETAIAPLALQQGRLCSLVLGEVARHLREAHQLAIAVLNGIDHNGRPKTAAVFADSPAFG